MAPLNVSLAPYYKGDTWEGFTVDDLLLDGSAPTANLASCRMQFRDKLGTLGYELNTVASDCKGTITIRDAATWSITVGGNILPLEAGTWYWDIEAIDANGKVLTILKGRLRVTADITHY